MKTAAPQESAVTLISVILTAARRLGIVCSPGQVAAAERSWQRGETDIPGVCQYLGVPIRKLKLSPGWRRRGQATPLLLQTSDGAYLVVEQRAGRWHVLGGTGSAKGRSDLRHEAIDASYALYASVGNARLSWKTVQRIARAIGSYRDLIAAVAAMICSVVVSGLFPIAAGLVLGNVVTDDNRDNLAGWAILLTGASVVAYLVAVWQGRLVLRLASRMDVQWTAAMWDRVLRLPIPFFRAWSPGELVQRIFSLDAVRSALVAAVTVYVSAVSSGLVAIFILIGLGGSLALSMITVFVALVVIAAPLVVKLFHAQVMMITNEVELNGVTVDLLQGVAKIRVAGAEDRAEAVWDKRFRLYLFGMRRSAVLQNALMVTVSVFAGLATAVLFLTLADRGPSGIGPFTTGVIAVGMLAGALIALSTVGAQVAAGLPAVKTVEPILRQPPEAVDVADTCEGLRGEITISSVTFGYEPGIPVIDDLSLEIKAGEYLAITGPSGAGKSTLVSLMLAFDQPWRGSISYDGTDLDHLNHTELRRQIGTVLQDLTPPAGSILQAILAGRPFGEGEAWRVADEAGIAELIEKLPMKMHTILASQAGTGFSGGQMQRILLARALVGNPRLLLLDEATSSLDDIAQDSVIRLVAAMPITRVVIAHRLSTIMDAHRIVVVDQGQAVESGTYAELMAANGLFHELASSQHA